MDKTKAINRNWLIAFSFPSDEGTPAERVEEKPKEQAGAVGQTAKASFFGQEYRGMQSLCGGNRAAASLPPLAPENLEEMEKLHLKLTRHKQNKRY